MLVEQNGEFLFHILRYSASQTWIRATAIADKLGIEFALIHRQKDGRTENEKMDLLVGDVKDKVNVIAHPICGCF